MERVNGAVNRVFVIEMLTECHRLVAILSAMRCMQFSTIRVRSHYAQMSARNVNVSIALSEFDYNADARVIANPNSTQSNCGFNRL